MLSAVTRLQDVVGRQSDVIRNLSDQIRDIGLRMREEGANEAINLPQPDQLRSEVLSYVERLFESRSDVSGLTTNHTDASSDVTDIDVLESKARLK